MSCHGLEAAKIGGRCQRATTLQMTCAGDMFLFSKVFQGWCRTRQQSTASRHVTTLRLGVHSLCTRSSRIIQEAAENCTSASICNRIGNIWQAHLLTSASVVIAVLADPCSRVGVNSRWFARLRAVKTFLENLAAEYYWGLFNRFRFLVVIWV